MFNKALRIILYVVIAIIILCVFATSILGFIGNKQTQSDIAEIRRIYNNLEESYKRVGDAVSVVGEDIKLIDGRVTGIEGNVKELGIGLRKATGILGGVSETVGGIEDINRELSDFIKSIDISP